MCANHRGIQVKDISCYELKVALQSDHRWARLVTQAHVHRRLSGRLQIALNSSYVLHRSPKISTLTLFEWPKLAQSYKRETALVSGRDPFIRLFSQNGGPWVTRVLLQAQTWKLLGASDQLHVSGRVMETALNGTNRD